MHFRSEHSKILAQQEYCGDVINFKTYSKNFKNKKRLQNPEENWKIFKNVHEPIIDRDTFAVRKFMQMETITPALLNELIEKIEVHSIEGKGKNKTQRIVIHYRFIGVIENPVKEENIVLEARQGVAVEYLTA